MLDLTLGCHNELNLTSGELEKAWDEAIAKGWTVVDMKDDWKRVSGFEPSDSSGIN